MAEFPEGAFFMRFRQMFVSLCPEGVGLRRLAKRLSAFGLAPKSAVHSWPSKKLTVLSFGRCGGIGVVKMYRFAMFIQFTERRRQVGDVVGVGNK